MTHTFPYACVKKCYKFYSITFLMFVKKSVLSMKKKIQNQGNRKKKKKGQKLSNFHEKKLKIKGT